MCENMYYVVKNATHCIESIQNWNISQMRDAAHKVYRATRIATPMARLGAVCIVVFGIIGSSPIATIAAYEPLRSFTVSPSLTIYSSVPPLISVDEVGKVSYFSSG